MTKREKHDCFDCLQCATKVSRARWVCRGCGKDVSVAYLLLQEAIIALEKP